MRFKQVSCEYPTKVFKQKWGIHTTHIMMAHAIYISQSHQRGSQPSRISSGRRLQQARDLVHSECDQHEPNGKRN
jgi:hypothetical protein